jgi:hypothetical protein
MAGGNQFRKQALITKSGHFFPFLVTKSGQILSSEDFQSQTIFQFFSDSRRFPLAFLFLCSGFFSKPIDL